MDEKISTKAINEYSLAYAARLTDKFFAKKQLISGVEILSLSDVNQVNLFVVRELMNIWAQETERMKSPFFDYQASEVKTALVQFQNVLSNHISIERKDFQPLVAAAVTKTIQLIVTPYDFYSEILDRFGKGYLKTSVLRSELKYLKINKAPLEKLLIKLDEQHADETPGNEAFGILDHILEEVNFAPEELDQYLALFSKVLPLRIETLFEQKATQRFSSPSVEPPKSFQPPPSTTKVWVPETPSSTKGNRIRDNLTINQKFMFTKILFKGDFEIFSKELERLESIPSLQHALAHLGDNYPTWDRESEEYEEFLEVLKRRFS